MARGDARAMPRAAGIAGLSVMAMAAAVWMTVKGGETRREAVMHESLLAEMPGYMGSGRPRELRREVVEGATLPPFASADRNSFARRTSWKVSEGSTSLKGAHLQQLKSLGLGSLLSQTANKRWLRERQLEVLKENQKRLFNDFFGNEAKESGSLSTSSALASAGELASNVKGGEWLKATRGAKQTKYLRSLPVAKEGAVVAKDIERLAEKRGAKLIKPRAGRARPVKQMLHKRRSAKQEESGLEAFDEMVFGSSGKDKDSVRGSKLPGVNVWGFGTPQAPVKRNLARKLRQSRVRHNDIGLRMGVWTGEEGTRFASKGRLQELALPSVVRNGGLFNAADEVLPAKHLGAVDYSKGSWLNANSLFSEEKMQRAPGDDVRVPCSSTDSALCMHARRARGGIKKQQLRLEENDDVNVPVTPKDAEDKESNRVLEHEQEHEGAEEREVSADEEQEEGEGSENEEEEEEKEPETFAEEAEEHLHEGDGSWGESPSDWNSAEGEGDGSWPLSTSPHDDRNRTFEQENLPLFSASHVTNGTLHQMPLYEPESFHLDNEPDYYPTTHLDLSSFPPAPTGGEWNDKIRMDPSASLHDEHPLPGVLVDSWFGSTIKDEVEKSHSPVIESDQPMNEGIGTGYLFGRDGGRITDDTIVPVHQVQRATYPVNIRPHDSLTQ